MFTLYCLLIILLLYGVVLILIAVQEFFFHNIQYPRLLFCITDKQALLIQKLETQKYESQNLRNGKTLNYMVVALLLWCFWFYSLNVEVRLT
jgi:hypothetical protein